MVREVEKGADPSNDDCRLLGKIMKSLVRPVGVCPAGGSPIGDLVFVRFPGGRGVDQVSDVSSSYLLLLVASKIDRTGRKPMDYKVILTN